MKKTLLAFTVASFATLGTTQAQLFLSENFNAVAAPALPSGWSATQWTSGAPLTVAPYFNNVGQPVSTAAHSKVVGVNGNLAATTNGVVIGSTAFTPASGAALIFDKAYFQYSLTADPTKKEKLMFVVSTNGGTTWTEVSEIAANASGNTWETNSISLTAYAGQNIKIGFKYSNNNGALVGALIDNVKVILGTDVSIVSAIGGDHPANGIGYQQSGTSASITAVFRNTGTTTLTNALVYYKSGSGAPVSATISAAPLATATATFTTPLSIATNTAYPVKVYSGAAADVEHSNDSLDINIQGVPFIPAKKLVFEEGTGTWCGWCPRGAVFMEEFAADHPGVAAQIAVHNNDIMEVSAYDDYMSTYIGGFPNMVVDRMVDLDPSQIQDAYDAWKDNFGFAELTMGTPANGTVSVTVKPAINLTNAKLALVVTESNLSGTTTQWKQTNYYAGGGQGTMGGWESQAASVAGVNYHFVARSITSPAGGIDAGLPATLTANTTYTATLNATINSTWKTADLQYLVLLLNGSDATVMNSAFSTLPSLLPGIGGGTIGISNVDAGIQNASLYPNPTSDKAFLEVNIKDAVSGTITITDATGRTVVAPAAKELHGGNNVIEVATGNLSTGMYFVNLLTAKGNVSLKLQVVK